MNSVDLLYNFVGKNVADITEHLDTEFRYSTKTYIKVLFDDNSFICFPRSSGESFWFKYIED